MSTSIDKTLESKVQEETISGLGGSTGQLGEGLTAELEGLPLEDKLDIILKELVSECEHLKTVRRATGKTVKSAQVSSRRVAAIRALTEVLEYQDKLKKENLDSSLLEEMIPLIVQEVLNDVRIILGKISNEELREHFFEGLAEKMVDFDHRVQRIIKSASVGKQKKGVS